jgi:predicted NBD/HSP70 family sugar kinase
MGQQPAIAFRHTRMDRARKGARAAAVPDTVNVEAVLSVVGAGRACSRAAVARTLGLSRTTISTIVAKLMSLGLVAEKSTQRRGRGRPGIDLDLDESRWRALGAEYHSGKWSFVATDLKGATVSSETRSVDGGDAAAFVEALVDGLGTFIDGIRGDILPAVGIGTPGLVDCDRGVIIRADDLFWKDVAVGEAVEKALGLEALLINRNRAAGLAEARFGAGRGVHGLVYIGIGTGISAAFIIDGLLMNGSSFSAGEIGHVVMDTAGPVCGCGKRGCLQAFSSGSAMGARAAALIESGRPSSLAAGLSRPVGDAVAAGKRRGISGEDVCVAAAEGDELALECVAEAAHFLGLETANIVTSFNPDKIVIGGPIGLVDGPLIDLVRDEASLWAMPAAFQAVTIERGRLGDYVGARGAACRVLDQKLRLALAASSGATGFATRRLPPIEALTGPKSRT